MPLLTPPTTRFVNQITRHIERTIGPSPMVFHEMISTNTYMGLHIVPPHGGRNCHTIVTSGMSAWPMIPPPGAEADATRYAELMVVLPADWPGLQPDGTLVQEEMEEEENWWPIRCLKMIARMPHEYGTWVGAGHMVPNGEHEEPYAGNTGFGGVLLLPSALHPQSHQLVAHDDVVIEFLALWPVYPEEMAMQRARGTWALRAALARAGVTEMVDVRRRNVAR